MTCRIGRQPGFHSRCAACCRTVSRHGVQCPETCPRADDGTTAQWPDNWREGLTYFYEGIWTDHFIPDQTAVQSLADGNTFQSGRVAMDVVHQWYTCCVYPGEGTPSVTDWDIAVLPEGPDGTITSKLHADTIAIINGTDDVEDFHAWQFRQVQGSADARVLEVGCGHGVAATLEQLPDVTRTGNGEARACP